MRKNGNPIYEIYSKTSLASPILASAKHEVILSIIATDYNEIDGFIEAKVDGLYDLISGVEYLTIIASPDAIDMSNFVPQGRRYLEVDNSIYGDIKNDGTIDLSVGRIFGITLSDISSNIGRALFYAKIKPSKDLVSVIYERHAGIENDKEKCLDFARSNYLSEEVKSKFLNSYEYGGSDTENYVDEILNQLSDSTLFIYNDHGVYDEWSYYLSERKIPGEKYPLMKPNIILNEACLTCAFRKMSLWKFKEIWHSNQEPLFEDVSISNNPLKIEIDKIGFPGEDLLEVVSLSISSQGVEWISCGEFEHIEDSSYTATFYCPEFNANSEIWFDLQVEGGKMGDRYSAITIRDAGSNSIIIKKEGDHFNERWYYSSNLLCSKMIRNGAVVFHTATDYTYGGGDEIGYLTEGLVVQEKSIGQSIKTLRNTYGGYYPSEIIIGDPTFKI